jgi:oxalyl-CoA decarboxylase
MLVGTRLNWLLSNGQTPLWSGDTQLIQVDISPTEIDSNRAIAAPVVGDIKSAMAAFLTALKPRHVTPGAAWLDTLAEHKQKNIDRMVAQLSADPHPMNFSSALRAVRDVLADKHHVYVVNEGANTLDFTRNIIDMYEPRRRLDSSTFSVMGVGQGYAIAAAVVSGKPVVAIEGDSAWPALISCAIDPSAGTESGHIQSFNPRSALQPAPKRDRSSNGAAAGVNAFTHGL